MYQSDPLLDSPYAHMLPSWLNSQLVIAIVPSSDKVFGSKNTLGSLSNVSCTYKTLKQGDTYELQCNDWMDTIITFGSANRYFCRSSIYLRVERNTNILGNPITVLDDHEYPDVPCRMPNMVWWWHSEHRQMLWSFLSQDPLTTYMNLIPIKLYYKILNSS